MAASSNGTFSTGIISGGTLLNNSSFIVIAASAGKKILVNGLTLHDVSGSVIFQDGQSGAQLSSEIFCGTRTSYCLPFSDVPWYKTSSGSALAIRATPSGAVARGDIIYNIVQ